MASVRVKLVLVIALGRYSITPIRRMPWLLNDCAGRSLAESMYSLAFVSSGVAEVGAGGLVDELRRSNGRRPVVGVDHIKVDRLGLVAAAEEFDDVAAVG